MPWTFAHPAAVLPVHAACKKHLPLLGLVVGSLVPDFGKYWGMSFFDASAHRALGLFTHCLPIGLLLCLIIQRLHIPFAMLLPSPHRQALLALQSPSSGASWLRLAIGILIGAFSHHIWDAFTHFRGPDATSTAYLPFSFVRDPRHYEMLQMFQYASSFVGVLILVVSYNRWLRSYQKRVREDGEDEWRRKLIWLLGFLAITLAAPLAWFLPTPTSAGDSLSHFLVRWIIYSTTTLSTIFAIAAWALRHRWDRA